MNVCLELWINNIYDEHLLITSQPDLAFGFQILFWTLTFALTFVVPIIVCLSSLRAIDMQLKGFCVC